MRILRVFPQRNSYTPRDAFAVVGFPPLPGFYPNGVDEVHISCTFTWDIAKCQELAMAWAEFYPVTLGGPAFNSPCGSFKAGFYVRPGITFTSRGCNNQCPWCFVPEREGKFYPFRDFEPGHIVQDNNLLQADRSHLRQVFACRSSPQTGPHTGVRPSDQMPSYLKPHLLAELRTQTLSRPVVLSLAWPAYKKGV
jgi:hypothetical protein